MALVCLVTRPSRGLGGTWERRVYVSCFAWNSIPRPSTQKERKPLYSFQRRRQLFRRPLKSHTTFHRISHGETEAAKKGWQIAFRRQDTTGNVQRNAAQCSMGKSRWKLQGTGDKKTYWYILSVTLAFWRSWPVGFVQILRSCWKCRVAGVFWFSSEVIC